MKFNAGRIGKTLKAVLAFTVCLNFVSYDIVLAFNNDPRVSMLRTKAVSDKDGGADKLAEDMAASLGVPQRLTSAKIRTELKVPEGQAAASFTNVYHEYTLNSLLAKPVEMIPDAVVDAVKAKLNSYIAEGKILSADVNDFGGTDIDIHVTHNYGTLNAAVHRLMIEAVREGALKAQEWGLFKKDIDVKGVSLTELGRMLGVQVNENSIKERASEPVVIAKIIGGSIGAANIKLFHEFAVEGSTPLKHLGLPGSPGFRFVVRKVEDVLKGNFGEESLLSFEISSARTVNKDKPDEKYYPSVNQGTELLDLASQGEKFVITAVYPVEGSKLPINEPLATVIYQPAYSNSKLVALNPTIIYRSQSGADAVAGVASMVYDPNFVPGGPDGNYYVVTKPVTLEQARKAPPEGQAWVVVYGYQSKGNGMIAMEAIDDHVGLNPPALRPEQLKADWLARVMTTHPDDQPYLTPAAAEKRAEEARSRQKHLFKRSPKETDVDPIMAAVDNLISLGKYLFALIDKADVGGEFGHNVVPVYMQAIYRATLMEAIESGKIVSGNIIGYVDQARLIMGGKGKRMTLGIGDDGEMVMLGDKTRNAEVSHQLSFLAFTRAILGSVVGDEKPYGRGQDFAGAEAKLAMSNPYFYAQFNQRFFDILRDIMPEEYKHVSDNLERGWKEWLLSKQETTTLPPNFSGNVSGQGMGSAGYALAFSEGERTFGVLAADKMGPAAYNRPVRAAVYAALAAGDFKNGLILEIQDSKAFDRNGNIPLDELPAIFSDVAGVLGNINEASDRSFVEGLYKGGELREGLSAADGVKLAGLLKNAGYVPSKRIFLDAEQNKKDIFAYLSDSDRFNVKRVWEKSRSGWNINDPQAYLLRPVLGSSVTKLGILAGGEYIGKDDPVMVGSMKLMQHIFAFLKKNPLIIQGDMNGSHWLAAIPTEARNAVATKESHPILVGFEYTVSNEGKLASVKDVFGEDAKGIRNWMLRFNFEFKRAQLGGQMRPYSTGEETVEASYPLLKEIRKILAETSPFRVGNMLPEDKKGKDFGLTGELFDLFSVATAADMRATAAAMGIPADGWHVKISEAEITSIAGDLGVSSGDVAAYLQASADVYSRYSGARLDKFLESLNQAQAADTTGDEAYTRGIVFSADVIGKDTASKLVYTKIIEALAKVDNLQVYIYAKNQQEARNLQVLTRNKKVAVISDLGDIKPSVTKPNTLLLALSEEDQLLKDRQSNSVRQLQAVNPVLTAAAALNALYGQIAHDSFRQFFKQVAVDDKGIENGKKVYESKQGQIVRGRMEAGELSKMLDGIKTDVYVTEGITEVVAQSNEVVNRIGV